jgi:aspartate carbamoyltransferase catalytic subunit
LKIAPDKTFLRIGTKDLPMLSVFSSTIILKKGETLIDTVNNILSMKVDMVVMRHANPGAAYFSLKCKSKYYQRR